MLSESVRKFTNVSVASFENLFLVNYARQIDASFILRGIRNEQDYGFERGMRYINAELNPVRRATASSAAGVTKSKTIHH